VAGWFTNLPLLQDVTLTAVCKPAAVTSFNKKRCKKKYNKKILK
jgi:hypothetical protein